MPSKDRIIRDYFGTFAGILDKSGIVADRSQLRPKPFSQRIQAGTSLTRLWDEPNGIRFIDNSQLTFYEHVDVIDEQIIKISYTYRFVSKDRKFTFRYDKDSTQGDTDVWKKPNSELMWHPLHHLHFHDEEAPRYKTHETSLEEILTFIRMSFVPR